MMGSTMNLINETHHSYKKRKYVFMVLREYTINSFFDSGETKQLKTEMS